MATLDLCSRGPDFFHFLKVQTFESAIEAFIRLEYLLLFFAHNSLTQKTLRFEYFSRQDAKKPLLPGDHRRNEIFYSSLLSPFHLERIHFISSPTFAGFASLREIFRFLLLRSLRLILRFQIVFCRGPTALGFNAFSAAC